MDIEQMKSMYDEAMKMPKDRVAFAFVNAISKMTKLTTVLETYIGTESVIKLSAEEVTDEFVESLLGDHETNPELYSEGGN